MAKKNSTPPKEETPIKKTANTIIMSAGTQIIKSSLHTTKSIFALYKEAGWDAMKYGKKLFKETLKLTLDNQKSVVNTSNKAIKETVDVIRQNRNEEKKEVVVEKRKDLTIDELLNS